MPLRHLTSRSREAEEIDAEPKLDEPARTVLVEPSPAEIVAAAAADAALGDPDASGLTVAAPLLSEPTPAAAAPEPVATRSARLVEGDKPILSAPAEPSARRWNTARIRAGLQAGLGTARLNARPLMAGGAVCLALGFGYLAGSASSAETAATFMAQREETARLASEVGRLRVGLDASRAERASSRTDAKQAQLLDKVERTGQDNSVRIGRLADQLERIEKAQRDTTRSQLVLDRIDKLERALGGQVQVAAAPSATPAPAPTASVAAPAPSSGAPTPPPKPSASVPDVVQTGSLPDKSPAKSEPDPRKTPLDGYVLRDVDEGYALIETRSGRFHEVMVGQVLPGIGRVEAIERRGRQWVVVTPKGFVAER